MDVSGRILFHDLLPIYRFFLRGQCLNKKYVEDYTL